MRSACPLTHLYVCSQLTAQLTRSYLIRERDANRIALSRGLSVDFSWVLLFRRDQDCLSFNRDNAQNSVRLCLESDSPACIPAHFLRNNTILSSALDVCIAQTRSVLQSPKQILVFQKFEKRFLVKKNTATSLHQIFYLHLQIY